MRLRPANIRLINRRPDLPRLLPALSSIHGKGNDKNNTTNVQGLTGHSISEQDDASALSRIDPGLLSKSDPCLFGNQGCN
jgi:hypothetical protein